jgi:phosphoglycerate kinase
MKTIDQLGKNELSGKKVLLRVDFNVPVIAGKIAEVFRIKAVKETVDYLLGNGTKVALVSHIEAVESFSLIVEQIGEVLGQTLVLVPFSELNSLDGLFNASPILLLDNVRQDKREIENDKEFARELSAGFDFYVNDAFAVCHRNHASVSVITEYLPSYAGFLIKKETENLSEALKAPAAGKIVVLGGAKISTKLPVIKNFLDKAEKILIGGAIANSFFKARGIQIGASVVDDTVVDPVKSSEAGAAKRQFYGVDVSSPKIVLPESIVVTEDRTGKSGATSMPLGDIAPNQMIVDICPEFAEKFAEIIKGSEMAIWNGPMGLSEIERFAQGTKIIARAVALASHSIVGGGDTIAAADKLGLLDKYGFVSTGGGAMLEFLADEKLPGLEALGYYK